MTILVDQDGVLADFEEEFYKRWRKAHPEKFHKPLGERENFPLILDYPEELHGLVRSIYEESGFYRVLRPIPGGIEALTEMERMGHVVYICTAPMYANPTCMTDKVAWIKEHLGEDFARRTIITKDKTPIAAHMLIDDKPLISGAVRPQWEHVIFDRAYNKGVEGKRRITWQNWRSVLSELSK